MNECKNKVCKKHGLTEHVQESNGYFRCKRCRNDHVIKRRQDVKIKLVNEFGGVCKICGYSRCIRNLSFHHKDPLKKDFTVSKKGRTSSFNILKKVVSEPGKKFCLTQLLT